MMGAASLPGTDLVVCNWWRYDNERWGNGAGALCAVLDTSGVVYWQLDLPNSLAVLLERDRGKRSAVIEAGVVFPGNSDGQFDVADVSACKAYSYEIVREKGAIQVERRSERAFSQDEYLKLAGISR